MVLKVTRWRPDTCGCELYYAWDDETSEDERIHTPIERHPDGNGGFHQTKRCPMHFHHSDVDKLHNSVKDHNRANNKNRTVN